MSQPGSGGSSTLRRVFVSHSHVDQPLAQAFKDALTAVFTHVDVGSSSDVDPGGGPPPGSSWLDWIYEQIRECQEALLLLTPATLREPWPMWEAGAVGGIALAAQATNPGAPRAPRKPLAPIRFAISDEQLAGPFMVMQTVDGTSEPALRKLLTEIMQRHDYDGLPVAAVQSVLDGALPRLAERIRGHLRTLAGRRDQATRVLQRNQIVKLADHIRRARRTIEVIASTGKEIPIRKLEAHLAATPELRIRLVLLDPKSVAAGLWSGSYARDRTQEFSRSILQAAALPNTELRLSPAYISSSLFATDAASEDGLQVVNFHTFGDETEDRPFLELRAGSEWYPHFLRQFERLWQSARPFRLRLASSGVRDCGGGIMWFPLARSEANPIADQGVVIDHDLLLGLFGDLHRNQDFVAPDDALADPRPLRAFAPDGTEPRTLAEFRRLAVWPVVGSDPAEQERAVRLLRERQLQQLRGHAHPLVSLDALGVDFDGDGAAPLHILRFPELLSCIERCRYRPPVPFFVADAASLPQSLMAADFRDQPDTPTRWSMRPCNHCGREAFELKFYVGPQRIVECRDCGLEMANPQPNVFDQLDAFSKYALPQARPRREVMRLRAEGYADVFVTDVAARGAARGRPLVELGSAAGEFLEALTTRGWTSEDLVGIDICGSSVELAHKLGRPRTIHADVEHMPLGEHEGHYGYVVIINTIEHFRDPLGVLRTARKMLAPGGAVFVANVPNGKSVHGSLFAEGFISRNFADGQHLFHFNHESFEKLCQKAQLAMTAFGKRKDIVHDKHELGAIWIAHQCGVDLRGAGAHPPTPFLVDRLLQRLASHGAHERLASELRDRAASIRAPEHLVQFWRDHVWTRWDRSDCFDAWLTAQ